MSDVEPQIRPVLHLAKPLRADEANSTAATIVGMRDYQPCDLLKWLVARNSAFAELHPSVRTWEQDDFNREICRLKCWSPGHTQVAVHGNKIVGSATLAICNEHAAIHALFVCNDFRRQGVARSLVARIEQLAIAAGHQTLTVQTHRNWNSAVAFYRSLGYLHATTKPAST